MKTFIAILRGINVGGHNKIKMQELKLLMESLDFENVRTYIQSGNVIFESKEVQTVKLADQINIEIATVFKLNVPVIVITLEELRKVINDNPFINREDVEANKLHVTFLSNDVNISFVDNIEAMKYMPDEFKILNKAIYLYCPNGVAKTKLTNSLFEKKLNQTATNRNWNTVNKIYQIGVN